MRAKDRSSTLRLLGLAAILIAAGLLSLRAYMIFTADKAEPVGSAIEQQLTYLLEPITGQDKVRVSVTGLSPKTVLVMIDGDMATDLRPLRSRIETILTASIGFDPERDALTLTQFPYASGVGSSLTAIQLSELLALGGLTALLLAVWMASAPVTPIEPRPSATQPLMPIPQQPVRLAPPPHPAQSGLDEATDLAERHPNETAQVVRDWMSYAEE